MECSRFNDEEYVKILLLSFFDASISQSTRYRNYVVICCTRQSWWPPLHLRPLYLIDSNVGHRKRSLETDASLYFVVSNLQQPDTASYLHCLHRCISSTTIGNIGRNTVTSPTDMLTYGTMVNAGGPLTDSFSPKSYEAGVRACSCVQATSVTSRHSELRRMAGSQELPSQMRAVYLREVGPDSTCTNALDANMIAVQQAI